MVQLMLQFHWLGSPWRQADIFRNSSSSRIIDLLSNMVEWEKRKRQYKSLLIEYSWFTSYIAIAEWPSAIVKWSHCKVKPLKSQVVFYFLFLTLTYSYLVSLWLSNPGNNCNNNYFSICTGNITPGYTTDLSSSIGT